MTNRVINAIKPGLVVLVTAGTCGIGYVISKAFLDHGCHVYISRGFVILNAGSLP